MKALKYLLGTVIVLALLVGGYWAWGQKNLAKPTAQALAALVSDSQVRVEDDDWLVFSPASAAATTGVIFYPGANCDVRGYAPIFRKLAAAGYLVVDVRMPFNFAIYAPDRADAVRAAFPEVRRWVMMGHSMGGAMAGYYAYHHSADLAGLVVWDSYPPESNDLSESGLPIWHIHRALADGSPPEKFTRMRHLYPADSQWVPIRGGIHMYFGSFDGGGYVDQWKPTISRDEQLDEVTAATLKALAAITASG
jgi:pimeloyl-ACP methyl ester carboxylesterase